MKKSKIIKLDNLEVKITGLPMNKNIELMSIMQQKEREGREVEAMLSFMEFIEMKKCCIPVIIKKEDENFEDGFDFFIEDRLLDMDDISVIFDAIFELSNGEEANEKRKSAVKKIQQGKDTTLNG